MKATTALICLFVFVAACAANPAASRPGAGDKLYEAVSGGHHAMLAVIDSRSHDAERELVLGTPSSDWKQVYTTVETSLVVTDAATGDVVNTLQLGGAYHLPAATANGVPGGLSPDGRWLVVEKFDGMTSHMLVIDTTAMHIHHQVALAGEFDFDAIDNLATSLYVIQHLDGGRYYVRLYDLAAGALQPGVVVDKTDGNTAMAGLRLGGIPSADGQWLYSLYVREHQAPFIHALSLGSPFALCIDLPGRGYLEDPAEMQWSLAMGPDHSTIYAVNAATGDVAVVINNAVSRSARFAVPSATNPQARGANGAVVSDGMLIAGGPAGLTWIDTSSLKVVARSMPGWSISTVGLSPNAKHLYAVNAQGRIAEFTVATRTVDSIFDPLAGTPMALMRVVAA